MTRIYLISLFPIETHSNGVKIYRIIRHNHWVNFNQVFTKYPLVKLIRVCLNKEPLHFRNDIMAKMHYNLLQVN